MTALKMTAALLLSGLLAACASPNGNISRDTLQVSQGVKEQVRKEEKVTANTSKSDVVCHNETMIGSHRKKVVCVTRQEQKEMQEAAEALTRAKPTVANPSH